MLDPRSAFSAVETSKNTNTDLQRACMKNKKLIVLAVGSRSAFESRGSSMTDKHLDGVM